MIEQITYLLFLKRLDELETAEELKANREKKPMQKRFFPEGKDKKKRSYQDFRWNRFKNFDPRDMYIVVSEHVFPWLRTSGATGLLTPNTWRERVLRSLRRRCSPKSWT